MRLDIVALPLRRMHSSLWTDRAITSRVVAVLAACGWADGARDVHASSWRALVAWQTGALLTAVLLGSAEEEFTVTRGAVRVG